MSASSDGPAVGDLLRDGTRRLAEAAVDAPRLTAETLLARAVGRDRTWLYAHPEARLLRAESQRFAEFLLRRGRREPTHTIIGSREFYGRDFAIGPAVLTPRPETELLVEQALAVAKADWTVVDVGCGSGAIALSLLAEQPSLRVIASDLSPVALAQTRRNAERLGLQAPLYQGDLLEPVRDEVFDLIVSNPPYLAERDRPQSPPELSYEPSLALYGGPDGLDVYRRLVPQAARTLRPGGVLQLEIGLGQLAAVGTLCQAARLIGFKATNDLQGIPRVVTARRPR